MGLFDIFKKSNKNSNNESQDAKKINSSTSDHNRESQLKEETIEFYDAYGTKMLISKLEWVRKVLPDQLQKHWNEPSELYNDILLSLNDGLPEYVVDAAQHLKEIDNIKERGYVILSIVYMKIDRNDDAQIVLEEYIRFNGKTGTVLTNLAKAYQAQGKHQKCMDTLWEGLQLDPNQENGLAWWLALKKEQGGINTYVQALHEASTIPGSYLPQLYTARNYIENKDFDTALNMYRHLIREHGQKDDVLFMISGDMGQAGLIKEMLDLVAPLFDVNRNNERIGFNLLQGYLETKNNQEGQKLISQLMQLNRPDLKQYLLNMSNEFEKMKDNESEYIDETPQIEMCSLNKPIWHYSLGDLKYLKTPSKDSAEAKIGILVYTNTDRTNGEEAHSEKETTMGRLTRSLPLFISELFHYYTEYQSITFVPIMQGVGPVLSGKEWSDDMLMQIAKSSELNWMITGNASMDGDEICFTTQIINVLENTTECVEDTMDKNNMGVPLMEHIFKSLKYISQIQFDSKYSDVYDIPNAENLMEYLNSLGQSLMQTLVVNGITSFEKIYGERNILNDYIMCCLHMPTVPQVQAIMASGLTKSKEYGSNIYTEFKEQALCLVNDYEKRGELNREIADIIKNL
jgi:tetratricopeptide (TPR) repeat protein